MMAKSRIKAKEAQVARAQEAYDKAQANLDKAKNELKQVQGDEAQRLISNSGLSFEQVAALLRAQKQDNDNEGGSDIDRLAD